MIQAVKDIFAAPPDESDLFLSIGTGLLFFGTYLIYPPASYILLGLIFGALALVAARAAAAAEVHARAIELARAGDR